MNTKTRWIVLACASLLLPTATRGAETASSVSQFGITWTFAKDYKCGRFANGDWWVVGPVKIVSINPPSRAIMGVTTNAGFAPGRGPGSRLRVMNGSMINPSPADKTKKYGHNVAQGYDSDMNQWHPNPKLGRRYPKGSAYKNALNVALNVSKSKPLIVLPGSSLVSSISLPGGGRPQLKTAAILTVLEKPAPAGAFRPPYCGLDKTIRFNKDDLKYDLLKKLKKVASTPAMSTIERNFERPWIDHVPDWLGRYSHPADNMPDYGREIASQIGEAGLMLNLEFTDKQKETLLVRFVQLGIDLNGIIQAGGKNSWRPAGGHTQGRKWPILFAGYMLDDQAMKNIGKKSGDYAYRDGDRLPKLPADYIQFNEDGQTFYVSRKDVERTNSKRWKPDYRNVKKGQTAPYTASDIGLPEWGIHHTRDPYQDNKYWAAVYRITCGRSYAGFVLGAQIMGLKKAWNHNALFDYMDRYMSIQEKGSWRQISRFAEEMWDTYRKDYPPVWTSRKDRRIEPLKEAVETR